MLLGVPLAVVLFGFLVVYFRWRLLRGLTVDLAQAVHIQDELKKLGPISTGQRNTLVSGDRRPLAVPACGSSRALAAGFARPTTLPHSSRSRPVAQSAFPAVNRRSRRFTLSGSRGPIDWGIVLPSAGLMGPWHFDGLAESIGRGLRQVIHTRHPLDSLQPGDDVRNRVEHRVCQHDRSGRDCRGPGLRP
jgi:hypothetical protein